jgi:hypothetical protein
MLMELNVQRFDDESDEVYNYRVNYIKKEYDNLELKILIKNSKILANMKFKNCRYHPKIFNNLKKFI